MTYYCYIFEGIRMNDWLAGLMTVYYAGCPKCCIHHFNIGYFEDLEGGPTRELHSKSESPFKIYTHCSFFGICKIFRTETFDIWQWEILSLRVPISRYASYEHRLSAGYNQILLVSTYLLMEVVLFSFMGTVTHLKHVDPII